jgi:hypothetical protein
MSCCWRVLLGMIDEKDLFMHKQVYGCWILGLQTSLGRETVDHCGLLQDSI